MSDDIEIVFVKRSHRIEIDMSRFTWGDALRLRQYRSKAATGEMSDEDAETVLSELVEKVTGQDPNSLPATMVSRVINAIDQAMRGDADPNSDGG